ERDPRWVHLLGDQPAAESAAPTHAQPAIDLGTRDERVRSAYDVVAAAYADALADELDGLPFERWLLDRVAALADGAPVVEVGCGPGHVTGYLAERGATATGVDLAPAMIDQARARYPLA